MKTDVHPEYHPVVFKDGEHEIITRSTVTSEETREIDGVEHYVVKVDISAFSHPFYTGTKKLVDTEGRVDRFLKRYNLDGDDDEEETADAEAEEADDHEQQEEEQEESADQETADTETEESADEESADED